LIDFNGILKFFIDFLNLLFLQLITSNERSRDSFLFFLFISKFPKL